MTRPALYVLVPLASGIALSGIWNIPVFYSIIAAALFVTSSLVFSKNKITSHIALFLAVLFTGMAVCLNSNILPPDHISNFIPSYEHNDVLVKGTIIDDSITSPTIYRTFRTAFTLKADSMKDGASWRKVDGLVKVGLFSKTTQAIPFGSGVLLEGTISKPHGLNNPGLFNYADYLELKDIYCCLNVREEAPVKILRAASAGNMKFLAYQIRHRMRDIIDKYLEPPCNGFLKAILIGDRTGLNENLKENFVKTGTVHILAISGLHVGLIAALFMSIFAFLRVPRKTNLALAAMLLIFYSIIAGSNPPIIRAVIMFVIYAVGYLIDRDSDTLNSLSIAAIAILLWNPKELQDPGFQLSFASVASIIIFTPRLENIFLSLSPEGKLRKGWGRAYKYITGGVAVSIGAWIGSLPVTAAYFNIVSPVSILANLIIIPILFILMATSFAFFILRFIASFAAAGIAQGLQFIEKALFAINGYLSGIPFAYFRSSKPSPEFIFLYYALILLMLMPPLLEFKRLKIRRTHIFILILVFFNIIVWPAAIDNGANNLKITFLDVGQGDSAFIEFPDGGNMLIDGGSGGDEERADMGRSVVAPFLWNSHAKTIDIVAVTHFHEDHMGGLLYVLKNFNVGCVIDNGAFNVDEGKLYEEYLRIIKNRDIRRISVRDGDLIRAFRDSDIFVLNPENNGILTDSNDNSLVLKLIYRDRVFLFCGDIKDKAISRLNEYGDFLRSDVIKVPHHGGGLGNNKVVANFFNSVSPKISVISVGAANKYGMPSGRTIDIITAVPSKIYMTKHNGAIEIYDDTKSNRLKVGVNNKN